MPFEDLPLDQPLSPPPPPRRPSAARWVIAVSLVVIAGVALVLWWMSRAQPGTAVPAPTTATDVAVGSNRPKRQMLDLPTLDASDTFIREMVSQLSEHPLIARFLATKGVVRAIVLAVEQIGDGRTPSEPLKVLRPDTRLATIGGQSGHIDPRSYARWNDATSSLVSIIPHDAAQLYVNVKPLFDQAYSDLGHPQGDFDVAIIKAIEMLEATPSPASDPELLRRPGYYEYADPALQSIPRVQKQFLLIGTENRHKIVTWLNQFAKVLDLKIE